MLIPFMIRLLLFYIINFFALIDLPFPCLGNRQRLTWPRRTSCRRRNAKATVHDPKGATKNRHPDALPEDSPSIAMATQPTSATPARMNATPVQWCLCNLCLRNITERIAQITTIMPLII